MGKYSLDKLNYDAKAEEARFEKESMKSLAYLLSRGGENLFPQERILLEYVKNNYIIPSLEDKWIFFAYWPGAEKEINNILENNKVNPDNSNNLLEIVNNIITIDNIRMKCRYEIIVF